MSTNVEIEQRYYAIKIADIENYLTPLEQQMLYMLGSTLGQAREAAGKDPVWGLFVESDWPEFEPTKELLLARLREEQA